VDSLWIAVDYRDTQLRFHVATEGLGRPTSGSSMWINTS
jgi:hypothetical protein